MRKIIHGVYGVDRPREFTFGAGNLGKQVMSATSKNFVFSLPLKNDQVEVLLEFLDAIATERLEIKSIGSFMPAGWPDAAEFLEAQIDGGHFDFTWREEEINDERSRIWFEASGDANIPLLANVLALAVEHFDLNGPLAIRWTSSSDEPDMAPVNAGIALIYRNVLAKKVETLHRSMDGLMASMLNDYQNLLIGQTSTLEKSGSAIDAEQARSDRLRIDRALEETSIIANQDGILTNKVAASADAAHETVPDMP